MKKTLAKTILLCGFLMMLLPAACATDPCDELEDKCSECGGSSEVGCMLVVGFDDQGKCDEALDDPCPD